MKLDWAEVKAALRAVQELTCPNRAEFARRMGVHRNSVDRILDTTSEPSLDTVIAWLLAARVQPSVFMRRFDMPVTPAVTLPPQTGVHVGSPLAPFAPDDAELLLRIGTMLTAAAQLVIAGAAPEDAGAAPPAPRKRHGKHD